MTSDSFVAWREGLEMNRLEVAAALGISRETIRAYETGRHAIPKYIALACAAVRRKLKPLA